MFSWKGIRQKFKQSESEKSKSILFDFSTFRNFTFRLFAFRLFEIQYETLPLFDFLFFDFSKLILHTFRLEPCITSFLPRTPLNSAEVHRVHRVAVAQRGGIAGAHPTQQRGTDQPLGR